MLGPVNLEALVPRQARGLLQVCLDKRGLHTDLQLCRVDGVAEIHSLCIRSREIVLISECGVAIIGDEGDHWLLLALALRRQDGTNALEASLHAAEGEALLSQPVRPALRLDNPRLIVRLRNILVDVPNAKALILRDLTAILLASHLEVNNHLEVVRVQGRLVPSEGSPLVHAGVDEEALPLKDRGPADAPVVQQARVLQRRGEGMVRHQSLLIGIILLFLGDGAFSEETHQQP
mmetsp:Transcript_116033/g.248067  ORF Transcript_116033/g.248067 Transcript_116033/m.248067 type:complete len:234 (+) Transcript_116033:795-1496(+)